MPCIVDLDGLAERPELFGLLDGTRCLTSWGSLQAITN